MALELGDLKEDMKVIVNGWDDHVEFEDAKATIKEITGWGSILLAFDEPVRHMITGLRVGHSAAGKAKLGHGWLLKLGEDNRGNLIEMDKGGK